MDVQKTKQYYKNLVKTDLCQCAYCQNYYKQIISEYPSLHKYLYNIGVDITKPFETMPLEPDPHNNIEYTSVQYVVLGNKHDFIETTILNTSIKIATSHPTTEILENHFIIEIYPIVLRWNI